MTKRYLQQEHLIFRQTLRKFLQKEAEPYYIDWEKAGIIPRDFWRKVGEQGFLCPWLEERYGGWEADFAYSVVLSEELEKVGSSLVGIALHNDIVVPYIASFGTEEQKQRWLPGCISGDLVTAIAMTEPGAGSDLAGIRTTAEKNGDHYILNGQKTFITNGIHADLVVVVCKTDPKATLAHRGLSLLVVEGNMPGFSRGRKLEKVGLHAQDTSELIFENAVVPKENLLGEEGKGFYYLMEKLQQERLMVAIEAQTATEQMLADTLEYVKSREAFGRPIGGFQHIAFRLAEMATEVEIGRTFLDDVIVAHMNNEKIVDRVSMAKWWITDMAKRTAAECMQMHGGYGYMEEFPIARRFRDIAVTSIYAGTNEIMKSIIARNMGLGG